METVTQSNHPHVEDTPIDVVSLPLNPPAAGGLGYVVVLSPRSIDTSRVHHARSRSRIERLHRVAWSCRHHRRQPMTGAGVPCAPGSPTTNHSW